MRLFWKIKFKIFYILMIYFLVINYWLKLINFDKRIVRKIRIDGEIILDVGEESEWLYLFFYVYNLNKRLSVDV